MLEDSISKNGYAIVDFKDLTYLHAIQETVKSIFPCSPIALHQETIADTERLQLIKQTKDEIVKQDLIKNFLLANSELLVSLLGPDIDMQSDIHLRVSRPAEENDLIDWHRDTFYGNSYWEFNLWFPVFPLEEGTGLMVIEGSHLMPSNNIRPVAVKENTFHKEVTKGSLANELGYVYAPKTDDAIANCDATQIKLLTPKIGQAILFFGYMAHRARNSSNNTRVSIDLRVKNMFMPTNTKSGYYKPLMRGVIANCVEKMISLNAVV